MTPGAVARRIQLAKGSIREILKIPPSSAPGAELCFYSFSKEQVLLTTMESLTQAMSGLIRAGPRCVRATSVPGPVR